MGGDIVVAVGRAARHGQTVFGQNCTWAPSLELELVQQRGRSFAPDERVRAGAWELPAARRTYTVLACRPAQTWGYAAGVNECGVAAGYVRIETVHPRTPSGAFLGSDLVRLVLERSPSARHAADLLTGWVEGRDGTATETRPVGLAEDCAFLVGDHQTAFAIETCATHWVAQEVLEVRAVSNVCTIHQDWDRISPGLAGRAIRQGWWPGDGSKLDFARALARCPTGEDSGLRRWGRATLLLEQQSGHADIPFLQRLLGDHYESMSFNGRLPAARRPVAICQHAGRSGQSETSASIIATLTSSQPRILVVWLAAGPPCSSLYFPLYLDGDIPGAIHDRIHSCARPRELFAPRPELARDPERVSRWREALPVLQAQISQEAAKLTQLAVALKQAGDSEEVHRRTTHFMRECVARFHEATASLCRGAHESRQAGHRSWARGSAP